MDACRERFGGVDILVNNAAVTGPRAVSPLLDLSDEKAGEILAVNLQAPLRCAQRAAEFMQRGVIVNVGSVAGHAAQPDELLVGDRSLRHI